VSNTGCSFVCPFQPVPLAARFEPLNIGSLIDSYGNFATTKLVKFYRSTGNVKKTLKLGILGFGFYHCANDAKPFMALDYLCRKKRWFGNCMHLSYK
jgi:hypothetical protein